MAAATNAQRPKQRPDAQKPTPSQPTNAIVASVETNGHNKLNFTAVHVDLRHASIGPMPVNNSRMRPIGFIHLSKTGGPTVSGSPRTASLSVGNIVAKSTKNDENSSTQLLAR